MVFLSGIDGVRLCGSLVCLCSLVCCGSGLGTTTEALVRGFHDGMQNSILAARELSGRDIVALLSGQNGGIEPMKSTFIRLSSIAYLESGYSDGNYGTTRLLEKLGALVRDASHRSFNNERLNDAHEIVMSSLEGLLAKYSLKLNDGFECPFLFGSIRTSTEKIEAMRSLLESDDLFCDVDAITRQTFSTYQAYTPFSVYFDQFMDVVMSGYAGIDERVGRAADKIDDLTRRLAAVSSEIRASRDRLEKWRAFVKRCQRESMKFKGMGGLRPADQRRSAILSESLWILERQRDAIVKLLVEERAAVYTIIEGIDVSEGVGDENFYAAVQAKFCELFDKKISLPSKYLPNYPCEGIRENVRDFLEYALKLDRDFGDYERLREIDQEFINRFRQNSIPNIDTREAGYEDGLCEELYRIGDSLLVPN